MESECETFAVAHGFTDRIQLLKGVMEQEWFINHLKISMFNTVDIENVVNKVKQVMCAGTDLFQIVFCLGRQIIRFKRKRIESENHIHRRAHFMADGCQKGILGFIAFFRCHEFCLKMLVFADDFSYPDQGNIHDKNENTAAEENSGNDQCWLAEKGNQKIANQEKNKQKNRDIQDGAFMAQAFLVMDLFCEVYKPPYIENHEDCAKIDHSVYYPIHGDLRVF